VYLSQDNQPDQRPIVARLAAQFQLPVEDVTRLYEHECAVLAIGAHVTKFLHIFAIRHVQEILRKRRIEKLALLAAGLALLPATHVPMPPLATFSTASAVVDKPLRP